MKTRTVSHLRCGRYMPAYIIQWEVHMMRTKTQAGTYVPKVSRDAVFALRRMAWFKNEPMTKTLNRLILNAIDDYDLYEVCAACRCKSKKVQCDGCIFKVAARATKLTCRPKKAS